MSEQEAAEVSPVAKALRSTGSNLIDASELLSGRETGLRTHTEIEATLQAIRILALDPSVGSLEKAQVLITAFQQEAARVGHACMVAYADLTRKAANDGRAPLLWYDHLPLCCSTSLTRPALSRRSVRTGIVEPGLAGCSGLLRLSSLSLIHSCARRAQRHPANASNAVRGALLNRNDKTLRLARSVLSM